MSLNLGRPAGSGLFPRERTIYAFLLGYAGRLVEGIDDARFADQPTPAINPPAWQIGHLAVVADNGLTLLGLRREGPRAWRDLFGTGSSPIPDRSPYPSKAELLSAYRGSHARLDEAVSAADPEAMERPHSLDFLKPALTTVGDLLAHLLTSHEAMHLGHLSSWRRQVGLPYLF